jgi:hypothetical protein
MGRTLLLLAPLIRGQRERQRPRHIPKTRLIKRPIQIALVALKQGQGFRAFRHDAHLAGFLALADADFDTAKLTGIKRDGERFIPAAKGE